MITFKQYLNEAKKLPSFSGFKSGSKIKFNDPKGADTKVNKVHVFVGTVVQDSKGKGDVLVKSPEYKKVHGESEVTVPYENIQGVV